MQVIVWANKSCDVGYPDTCLLWGGFLAKLAIYYDMVSNGRADVAIMNRVSCELAQYHSSLPVSQRAWVYLGVNSPAPPCLTRISPCVMSLAQPS